MKFWPHCVLSVTSTEGKACCRKAQYFMLHYQATRLTSTCAWTAYTHTIQTQAHSCTLCRHLCCSLSYMCTETHTWQRLSSVQGAAVYRPFQSSWSRWTQAIKQRIAGSKCSYGLNIVQHQHQDNFHF